VLVESWRPHVVEGVAVAVMGICLQQKPADVVVSSEPARISWKETEQAAPDQIIALPIPSRAPAQSSPVKRRLMVAADS